MACINTSFHPSLILLQLFPCPPTSSQIHDINRNCIRKDVSEPILLQNYCEANIKHTTKANQITISWENNYK